MPHLAQGKLGPENRLLRTLRNKAAWRRMNRARGGAFGIGGIAVVRPGTRADGHMGASTGHGAADRKRQLIHGSEAASPIPWWWHCQSTGFISWGGGGAIQCRMPCREKSLLASSALWRWESHPIVQCLLCRALRKSCGKPGGGGTATSRCPPSCATGETGKGC